MNLDLHEFHDPKTLAAALADKVAAALRTRLETAGAATLAVSGGTTPVMFFQALSARELNWAKVTITLTDDRWVPESSARSNARLVRTHLLQNHAATARFVPLVTDHATPEEAAAAVAARITALHLPLAAVVLGMGTDGHTASFFPDEDHLPATAGPAPGQLIWIEHKQAAVEPRVTLTFEVLLAAGFVALHIEGETKWAVLNKAAQFGAQSNMPIYNVLRRAPPPEIFWCP